MTEPRSGRTERDGVRYARRYDGEHGSSRDERSGLGEADGDRREADGERREVGSGRDERGNRREVGSGRGKRGGRRQAGSGRREVGGDRGEDTAQSAGTKAAADPEAIARQICLRMLTAAPRTQAQLAAALRRRGVPEDAAAAVLARFAEVKLIDDEMFARAWVESRHHGRGLAGRALGAELRQRGVGSDDIQAALSLLGPEQELTTARELVARRLASTAGMQPAARMRRLAGLLARRGYSPALAYRVIREALENEAGGVASSYDLDDIHESADDEELAEM